MKVSLFSFLLLVLFTIVYSKEEKCPDTPTDLRFAPGRLGFAWKKVRKATGYILQIKDSDVEDGTWDTVDTGRQTYLSLKNYEGGKTYISKVIAYNSIGQSPPSDTVRHYKMQKKSIINMEKEIYVGLPEKPIKIRANIENAAEDVTWSFNGNKLKDSDRISISNDKEGSSLEIKTVSTDDVGVYKITTSNDGGISSKQVKLKVSYGPPKPTLEILDVGDDFMYISFMEEKGQKDNFIPSTIIVLHDEDLDTTRTMKVNGTKSKRTLITDLIFGHEYNIQMYYNNLFGNGDSFYMKVKVTDTKDLTVPNCIKGKVLDTSQCKVCANGFVKKGSVCEKCLIDNCMQCPSSNQQVCEICIDGSRLFNGKCEVLDVDNCAEGNEDYCFFCQVGFYKTFDGECAPCNHEHCDLCYGPDEKCSYCEKGYDLQADGSCGKKSCGHVENCEICLDDKCHRCDYGYYFKSSACDACSNLIENCMNCNSKTKQCIVCADSHKLSDDGLTCVLRTIDEGVSLRTIDEGFSLRTIDKGFSLDLGYRSIPEEAEDEDEEITDDGPDDFDYLPKDSWGFPELEKTAKYYMEAEVQLHVSHTIYASYLAKFQNDHELVLSWIKKKFMGGYNFLGWAFNRLIVDDDDNEKFFLNLIPWELMIYVDNGVFPMAVIPKFEIRSTNPSNYQMTGLYKEFKILLDNIYEKNGAIADMHMYFSSSGLMGTKTGVALSNVWFGTAVGGDKAGGVLGHELGHTLGMPDSYMEGGNVRKYTVLEKYGTPGSYYSSYRKQCMKPNVINQKAFEETVCTPHDMMDGRRIGRVQVNEAFYLAADDTRDGICKKYGGETCEAKPSSSCTDLNCLCKNQYGDVVIKHIKLMIRGLECGSDKVCYDKTCGSDAMMKWNKDYTVDSAECRYKYEKEIIDAEIFPNYKCLDNMDNLCVFGRKDWVTGKDPFSI